MTEKNVIELDDRPITGIWWNDGTDGYGIGVPEGVTNITICHLPGEMGYIPWFEVWRGDVLYRRCRAGAVQDVGYAPPPA